MDSIITQYEAMLYDLSVSGRNSTYAPTAWAYQGGEADCKTRFHTTKRAAPALRALGNGSQVRALVRLQGGNKQRSFEKEGNGTVTYYETQVKRWVIVAIHEVIEQGVMPKPKEEDKDTVPAEDVLPS